MRVSTTQIYRQGIEAFHEQQSKLAKLQKQISTGVRLTKPSDDPAASSRVLELEQTVSQLSQYKVNISQAQRRLALEETNLKSLEGVSFRLKELAIQANSGSNDFSSLKAIRVEINERLNELMSLANARDANGDYLFAGYQSQNQPFTETISGAVTHVVYSGDQGQRLIQISETRQISVDNSGSELFLELSSATALNEATAAANTGTGVMAPATVFDVSAYSAGTFEIRFTAPGLYDVFDVTAGANIVTGAVFTAGEELDFQGIRTSITGAPAAGDVFTVSQGQYKNIFESVSSLAGSFLLAPTNAQRADNVAEFLTDLDNFFSRVLEVRTSIGGRMNALEGQLELNDASIVATQTTLSTLRDTDLAEAISQLTLEQTTLDAAQAVFARITSSSLFNFMR